MTKQVDGYKRDEGYIHVPLERLDSLLNLVGELVINRALFAETGKKCRVKHGFKEHVLDLFETVEHVGRIIDDIQERVIKSRMVPVEQVFDRFAAFVEELSGQQGKEIELDIQGRSTEIDKKVIDALSEPLVHLVRNAIDHGLETSTEREAAGKPQRGRITLGAIHEGNNLVIEAMDDGSGVDIESVKQAAVHKGILNQAEATDLSEEQTLELLFHPSFSTAREVTEMSGRGVGLDAARSQVEMLGGSLSAQTQAGAGTLFKIRLPITMAIIPALTVQCGGETYAIPLEHIEQTLKSNDSEITTVEGSEVLAYRNTALPIGRLRTILNITDTGTPDDFYIVVVRGRNATAGIVVDNVLTSQDIVVKPLAGQLSNLKEYTGAAIAADGRVFLALDVLSICSTALNESSAAKERQ